MNVEKFLTYWSLLFAILFIWIFSVAVALADVKDELLQKIQKQWVARGKVRPRPANPLADRAVAETLGSPARTESQEWVFQEVSRIAGSLRLTVRVVVLQDSMDHFLAHFAQDKRLVSYRVDKAWVADARAGKTDQLDRLRKAVEQYLRQEFLGEKPAPAADVLAHAVGPKPAAPAQAAAQSAAAPAAAQGGGAPAASSGGQAAAGAPGGAQAAPGEMTREEKIAAAKAKAEAIKAQREAAGRPPDQGSTAD